MKQGKPVINSVMIALAAALAIYFGVYLFKSFDTPYSSTLAYRYTQLDSTAVEGIIARDELVIPGQGGIVDVTRSEGERVGAGQTVAMVYRDSQAQAGQAELESLATEAALLTFAMNQSGDVESAAKLDETILQSLVELRDAASRNRFSDLNDMVVEVKSGVLKRSYTYGEDLTAGDLNARLADLKSQISALKNQSAGEVSRIKAQSSGTFSNRVDGFEGSVTPTSVRSLTPVQLRDLIDQGRKTDHEAVGKLITNERWSYAALVPNATVQRLKVNDVVTLRFTGDFAQDVEMQVDHIGEVVDGLAVVVFSSTRYLAETTLLRQQSAEIIFEHYSGIRVPKSALRMLKGTYTDEETGEEVPYTQLGVYVLVAGRTEFKPVKVLSEASDYYVLQPAASDRKALREGDEVITKAKGIEAGQMFNK